MTALPKLTDVSSVTNDELMLKELERRDGIYSFIFHELETPKLAYDIENKDLLPASVTLSEPISERSENCETPSIFKQKSLMLPVTHSTSAINILTSWRTIPPASFGTYHPCTPFATFNCRFRVCVASPTFSHLSAPLVRHRQHSLKDSVNYKSCGAVETPDIRALFPHDPDVHAPFTVAGEKSALELIDV